MKGEYGDNAFPSFSLGTKVDNGTFRYPDLPLPARDIGLDLGITNPGGDADSTDGQPAPVPRACSARTRWTRCWWCAPRSPTPTWTRGVAGKVDLADLRRTIKLEGVQELAGTIAADAAVRTRMSWVDSAAQYDRVAARGGR